MKEAISITAGSVNISPFWLADPQIWFAQIEAKFYTRGITAENTMFDHIVASLTPEYAQEVSDFILSPPESTPYTQLKKQLLDCTAASEQCCLQQLFHAEEPWDRRPTQLLYRTRTISSQFHRYCLPSRALSPVFASKCSHGTHLDGCQGPVS